jgi:prepilin peptidase CpaA
MGALSVWLGLHMTVVVMAVTIGLVLIGTVGVMAYSAVTRGLSRTKEKYLSRESASRHPTRDARNRRIMPYAIPLAMATWLVMIVMVPDWSRANGGARPAARTAREEVTATRALTNAPPAPETEVAH